MIESGAAWLNTQLKTNAATVRTYVRGAYSVSIAMTLGGPPNPLFSLLGSVPGSLDLIQNTPENAVRSFAFDAADLVLNGAAVVPEIGDQVIETINGVACVFTVMSPSTGALAWEWQGEFRQAGARYLVHTQLTGVQA